MLDIVGAQPFEKAHAEQAFVERAGTGDDRPDRDPIGTNLRRERRSIGGADGNVVVEASGYDAGPSRVGGGEDGNRAPVIIDPRGAVGRRPGAVRRAPNASAPRACARRARP